MPMKRRTVGPRSPSNRQAVFPIDRPAPAPYVPRVPTGPVCPLAGDGPLAQSVEQLTFNQWVAGSNPARLTIPARKSGLQKRRIPESRSSLSAASKSGGFPAVGSPLRPAGSHAAPISASLIRPLSRIRCTFVNGGKSLGGSAYWQPVAARCWIASRTERMFMRRGHPTSDRGGVDQRPFFIATVACMRVISVQGMILSCRHKHREP